MEQRHMPATRRYLIVNADDLGASAGVNRGILEAHERGIVTSASLMVDMPAAAEFASRKDEAPRLSVGLHATLTSEGGELKIELGECRETLERQLQRFDLLLGRAPTHLDSHHNVHLEYPALGTVFEETAAELGVPLRARSAARYYADFYGQWDDGESHPELVGVENLGEVLAREVGPGVTELGCHPGYPGDGFESSYLVEREAEVRTLCDPRVRERVETLGIRLIGFAELADGAAEL
jgi:chitin disaccharide deacetylase